jgi:hypothetical protein
LGSIYIVNNSNNSGTGSLRDHINSANGNAGKDTIVFDPSVNGSNINLISQIIISDDLCIFGNGIANTILDGNMDSRIFTISSSASVDIKDLTMQDGMISGDGGAILNNGNLMLTRCRIYKNMASDGGGIYNQNSSVLICKYCIFQENSTGLDGFGGGLENTPGCTAIFFSCVFSGNTSGFNGGGIDNLGNLKVLNCTIAGNSAGSLDFGGGINSEAGSVNITNSIIAFNTADEANIAIINTTLSGSHNFIADDAGQTFFVDGINGNIVGTEAMPEDPIFIGSLADLDELGSGLRLQICSPARNAGINDSLGVQDDRDLAGKMRVQNDTIDMGAFEFPFPEIPIPYYYASCPETPPCNQTVIIDDVYIEGSIEAADLIKIEGNANIGGNTVLKARQFIIDPVFEVPAGFSFETLDMPCN